jgi:hypothetical protein
MAMSDIDPEWASRISIVIEPMEHPGEPCMCCRIHVSEYIVVESGEIDELCECCMVDLLYGVV